MSIDIAALVGAVGAGLPEMRACLLLSHDGLPLAAYPDAEKASVRRVCAALAGLGEVERGFMVLRQEMWVVAQRGRDQAGAVAGAGGRDGLLLDRLEQLVTRAGEPESRRAVAKPARPPSSDMRPVVPPEPPVSVDRAERIAAPAAQQRDDESSSLAREFAGLLSEETRQLFELEHRAARGES